MLREKNQWLMVFKAILNEQIEKEGRKKGILTRPDGYSFNSAISIMKYLHPELIGKLNSLVAYINAGVYGKEENLILASFKQYLQKYFERENKK